MNLKKLFKKIRGATWGKVRHGIRKSPHYPKTFLSYWHYRFHKTSPDAEERRAYLTGIPNPGAGIGHQMANWIAGYWWARKFGLRFAHTPFSSPAWDEFLGFGAEETAVGELRSKQGYKVVLLPPFREKNRHDLELIEAIIRSYHGKKVVLQLANNQSYAEQMGVIDDIQKKFHHAPSRREDRLIYQADRFNIAVHVRRGDIVAGQQSGIQNHQLRWQDNDYFKNALENVLKALRTDKPVSIYLFSQGTPEDFKEFEGFDNLRLCLDMGAQDSFLHMVFADLLITSKSSFSYKPALLSKGIRVCPKDFWHGYPDDPKWILADADGSIGTRAIQTETLPIPAKAH